jgi:hypothetical protein
MTANTEAFVKMTSWNPVHKMVNIYELLPDGEGGFKKGRLTHSYSERFADEKRAQQWLNIVNENRMCIKEFG